MWGPHSEAGRGSARNAAPGARGVHEPHARPLTAERPRPWPSAPRPRFRPQTGTAPPHPAPPPRAPAAPLRTSARSSPSSRYQARRSPDGAGLGAPGKAVRACRYRRGRARVPPDPADSGERPRGRGPGWGGPGVCRGARRQGGAERGCGRAGGRAGLERGPLPLSPLPRRPAGRGCEERSRCRSGFAARGEPREPFLGRGTGRGGLG